MQSRTPKNQPKDDKSQSGNLLAGYLAYWPVFLIFIALAIGGAFMYLRYAEPRYQADAKVIIKDDRKGAGESKGLEAIDQIHVNTIIENEMEVLKSRELMENVVKNLHLYAPIFQEGKIRAVSAYVTCPITVASKNPDKIKFFEKILLYYNGEKKFVVLNNNYSAPYPLNKFVKTPYDTLMFLENPRFSGEYDKEKPFYLSLVTPKNAAAGLQGYLQAYSTSKLSSVLDISFTDINPRRAEDILDNLIYFYNQSSFDEKAVLIKNTIAALQTRLSVVRHELDSIEYRIQQFKTGSGAVALSVQSNLSLQGADESYKGLSEVNDRISALNRIDDAVSTNNDLAMLPTGVSVSDPTLNQMMGELNKLQTEYQKQIKVVGEGHPIIQSLKEQIASLKPGIKSSIEIQRKNLQNSRSTFSSSTGKYNSLLSTIPAKEAELLQLSRDQQERNNDYQFLLRKIEESELSLASTISDIKIVNHSKAGGNPVSPKPTMIYMAALFLGLLIPVGLISGRDLLSNKVLFRKEIESMTSLPVIGELIFNKSKESLVLEPGKRSFIAEEFRKIRVSLMYLGIDSHHKKILITSSIPGEGKTFVAANLAVSLAMTGKKVALVDMDLHNPSLGKLFGVTTKDIGVSEYLQGKNTLAEIKRELERHPNLTFVSSGTLHETPSELLENGKIRELTEELESEFDVIVMDTAPLVMVTDGYMLSSLADATLYVVRHQYTPKMLIKRIDENNKINALKNAAIIFNGVKTRGFLENNYGYGYDYVYGGDKKNKMKKQKA